MHSVPRKQHACPSNIWCWFRPFLVICWCLAIDLLLLEQRGGVRLLHKWKCGLAIPSGLLVASWLRCGLQGHPHAVSTPKYTYAHPDTGHTFPWVSKWLTQELKYFSSHFIGCERLPSPYIHIATGTVSRGLCPAALSAEGAEKWAPCTTHPPTPGVLVQLHCQQRVHPPPPVSLSSCTVSRGCNPHPRCPCPAALSVEGASPTPLVLVQLHCQ